MRIKVRIIFLDGKEKVFYAEGQGTSFADGRIISWEVGGVYVNFPVHQIVSYTEEPVEEE